MYAIGLLDKWLQRNAVTERRDRGHVWVRVVGTLLRGGKLARTHRGVTVGDVPSSNTTSRQWINCWAILTCIGNETVSNFRGSDGGCISHGHIDGFIPEKVGIRGA